MNSTKIVSIIFVVSFSDNASGKFDFKILAGEPATNELAGISLFNKESAPTTTPSPMVTPGITKTRQGNHTFFPMVMGANFTG